MRPATHVVLCVVSVTAVRFKLKCECRDKHIILNYACTEFNEIHSVVLSCYVQTDTRKLEDADQERQVPLEGLTNTDERTAGRALHEPESEQSNT